MFISDSIYGNYNIEKVLEELIKCQPVQRLKKIYQGGASYYVNKAWNVTRFEHSVGVMLLIKKLGGSIEEQIAGLLHDASHTAFSHVIDVVFDNQAEDYHETIYQQVIEESDIPEILEKHGFDYQRILFDHTKWTLLEQPAPELCADRVDYTLRDMYHYRQLSLSEVQYFLNQVVVKEGKMCVQTLEAAEWFVQTYYLEVIGFFLEPLNVYGYDRLANALKFALNKNVIGRNDLLKTDEEVMAILRSSEDEEIKGLIRQLHRHVEVEEDQHHYDIHRKSKVRLIDPSVVNGTELTKASALSATVKQMNEQAYAQAMQGMHVKIISN